jgi:hypothetical protein
MQCIQEPTKQYTDLDSLRQDLSLMDVKETPSFPLSRMQITNQGTVQVTGLGEFQLSDIALADAIRRGGLQVSSSQNFFAESKPILDEAIVNAVNTFYRHSRFADSELKLITRAGEANERITLGITSKVYGLFTHENAVEKVVKNLSPGLRLKRANLYPAFLELSFTDPIKTVRDKVGEVVELGQSYYNSQGTKTCALTVSSFAIRLVCLNGSTAAHKLYSARYIHKGDMQNHNSRFAHDTAQIFERFSVMMKSLPKLGEIPVTEKLISQIRPTLIETLKTKDADKFINGIDMQHHTAMDVWNKVTNLPHRIQNPSAKLRIEQLGFKILTLNLCYN